MGEQPVLGQERMAFQGRENGLSSAMKGKAESGDRMDWDLLIEPCM